MRNNLIPALALLFVLASCDKPVEPNGGGVTPPPPPPPPELQNQISHDGTTYDIGDVELRAFGQSHIADGIEGHRFEFDIQDKAGVFGLNLELFSEWETFPASCSFEWGDGRQTGTFSGGFTIAGGDTETPLAGGTLLMTVTGDTYELKLESTTGEEKELLAHYKGEVVFYPPVIPPSNEVAHGGKTYSIGNLLLFDFGQPLLAQGNENHNFDFMLTDKDRTFELYIETMMSSATPSDGSFVWSTSRQDGTFGCFFNPDTSKKTVFETVDGQMELRVSGDTYELTINCTTKQGALLEAHYKGGGNMVDTTPDFDNIPTTNSMVYGSSTYDVSDGFVTYYGQAYLQDYGIASYIYDIALYSPSHQQLLAVETLHQAGEFQSGVFSLSAQREPGTFFLEGMKAGIMEVNRYGNNYELKFNALDSRFVEINIYYKGELKPIGFQVP